MFSFRDPDIPPNSKLTYTIDLLSVEEAPDYTTWPINKRIEEGYVLVVM